MRGTASGDGKVYASGTATLGGYFPGVDTFLGLQIAAQEIADDLARQGFGKRIGPLRSTSQWLKWARGAQDLRSTMLPTLLGRIQTRLFLILVIGGLWAVVISPLLPGAGTLSATSTGAMYSVLLIVARARRPLGAALPRAAAVPVGEGLADAVRPAGRHPRGGRGLRRRAHAACFPLPSTSRCRLRGRLRDDLDRHLAVRQRADAGASPSTGASAADG